MDAKQALYHASEMWHKLAIPTLVEYIKIPNTSSDFDPKWKENGHMDKVVDLFMTWAKDQPIPGLVVERFDLPERTPIIFMEIPPSGEDVGTVLLYGHLDKQPEMTGWREGLGPWQPVLEGDRLYGRGGADDGYAMFASLIAVRLLLEQGLPHSRIVIIIEASEESGSPDLPAHVEAIKDRIGDVELVICLDSGCGDYERLWQTTSLLGVCTGDLTVKVLTEGVHSGDAGGIVPDSALLAFSQIMRVCRSTGLIHHQEFYVDIPADRRRQAKETGEILGNAVYDKFPWVPGCHPSSRLVPEELILRRTWCPTLTHIGVDGFPSTLAEAGNVMRPYTTLRLSVRTPPTLDAKKALGILQQVLGKTLPEETEAQITFTPGHAANGWNAPPTVPWLEESINDASLKFFGKPAAAMGEGGTIPFMGMLGEQFPEAWFLVTGVLGRESNAHGPNEFLHIPTAINLTACVAKVLTDHASR